MTPAPKPDPPSQLPEPPRRPVRGVGRRDRTARRGGLTEEAVVDAALAIVDTEGLDALTMRALSSRLHTGAASLYARVRSKDELIELLLERVNGEMPAVAEPDPARWREQLKAVAIDMRAVWGRHGDLARASFSRISLDERSLAATDSVIAILRAGGLSDRVVGLAWDLISLYVSATAYEDSLEAGFGMDPVEWRSYSADLQRYFTALPHDRFPHLVALSAALTSQADRFEFGLDVILAGLVAVDGEAAGAPGGRPPA